MADNVAITPGSGATVRTIDNGSGFQKQVMVLDVGGETAESLIGAGQPGVLPMKGFATKVTANYTRAANTTAYAAGQVVTASGAGAITLTSCGRVNGASGLITQVTYEDSNNAATPLQPVVYIFQGTAAPTSFADNAALALVVADLDNLVSVTTMTESYLTNAGATSTGNRTWIARGLSAAFVCGAATTSLWAYVVATAAYTPLSGEVFRFSISIIQN